jgi:hypothetical protein
MSRQEWIGLGGIVFPGYFLYCVVTAQWSEALLTACIAGAVVVGMMASSSQK